ncbi:hypothetical protein [Bacillus seohaeanensis]|uniref:Uncharacterized protein n=1 Tax=Bacillus seohaeanensis TaxID=284580 RepID=A0ABW5RUF7_9BACI
MEKIMYQSKEISSLHYIVVTLFSLLTLRKINKVEKIREKLKEQQEADDLHKL